jgi:hypothetical protein
VIALGRRWTTVSIVAALALGMTAATGTATGAAARPRGTAGMHPHLSHAMATGGRLSAVSSTSNGAGFYSYPGTTVGVAGVSTSFKMPAITCAASGDNEWLLPGIWVFSGGVLREQVDVNFNCNSGAQFRQAILCIGATCDTSLTVAPHDTIRASLAYTSNATIATLKDVTAGQTRQVVGPVVTTDYTVFIGDQGPALFGVSAVPTFTTVKFANNQVNAQDLSDWAPDRYNLKTASAVQIRTGALSPSQAFVTTFAHN